MNASIGFLILFFIIIFVVLFYFVGLPWYKCPQNFNFKTLSCYKKNPDPVTNLKVSFLK